MTLLLRFALLLVPIAAAPAVAAHHEPEHAEADKSKSEKPAEKDSESDSERSVTTGSVEIDGREVEYVATAGKLAQKSDSGDEKAEMFYVAYHKGRPPLSAKEKERLASLRSDLKEFEAIASGERVAELRVKIDDLEARSRVDTSRPRCDRKSSGLVERTALPGPRSATTAA